MRPRPLPSDRGGRPPCQIEQDERPVAHVGDDDASVGKLAQAIDRGKRLTELGIGGWKAPQRRLRAGRGDEHCAGAERGREANHPPGACRHRPLPLAQTVVTAALSNAYRTRCLACAPHPPWNWRVIDIVPPVIPQ